MGQLWRIDDSRPVLMGMTGRTGRHAGPMSEANAVKELGIRLAYPLHVRKHSLYVVEDADTGEQLTPPMPRVRAEFIASATDRCVRAVLA